MTAIWKEGTIIEQAYPTLQGDLEVDDVIIGAGITGLTTALKLLEAGRRVAVVEATKVADSSTGNSTGNLYATLSSGLDTVRAKWDDETVCKLVDMRDKALNFIEQVVSRFSIECEFKRVPLYWCITHPNTKLSKGLQAECDISVLAGLDAKLLPETPALPMPVYRALRIENQAQCNPFRLTKGLAQAVQDLGGSIFENSQVTHIQADDGVVKTAMGKVHASNIIQATHTPKGVNFVQAEMEVFREYGSAAAIEDTECPQGIHWILTDSQSVRSYSQDGKDFVIVVGGKHPTGKGEAGINYYDQVRSYANNHFGVTAVSHKWSAQQYKPADLLPYIGRSGHDHVFVATGFGADGLVWGAVAAEIICHQVLGKTHPGVTLFDPRRFTPAKSMKNWVKESSTVATELFKTYLTPSKRAELNSIAPGEGQVVKVDGEDLAIYHSPDKGLQAVSSICPHMKCQVAWNGQESTWDCPCHGSRFTVSGEVIEGPACEPLRPHVLKEKPN